MWNSINITGLCTRDTKQDVGFCLSRCDIRFDWRYLLKNQSTWQKNVTKTNSLLWLIICRKLTRNQNGFIIKNTEILTLSLDDGSIMWPFAWPFRMLVICVDELAREPLDVSSAWTDRDVTHDAVFSVKSNGIKEGLRRLVVSMSRAMTVNLRIVKLPYSKFTKIR